MASRHLTTFLSVMTLSSLFAISSFAEGGASNDDLVPFNVESNQGYQHIDDTLALYVKSKKAAGHVNDFCVIGYRSSAGENAWVYWRQKNALILWDPQKAPVADLMLSTRYLDLKRDVVASIDELHGSTYLVTRAWASDVIDTCKRIGTKRKL